MLDKYDKIAQALRCCVGDGEADCNKDGVPCPYLPVPTCVPKLNKDAADAIDALRREVENLRDKLAKAQKGKTTCNGCPEKDKCGRVLEHALAGVTGFTCSWDNETNAQPTTARQVSTHKYGAWKGGTKK